MKEHLRTFHLTLFLSVLFCLVIPGMAGASYLTGNGEKWYVRAYNVDDSAYMYACGNKVGPDVKYLGDSGWVNITSCVESQGANATVRFLLWNKGGPYKATFEIARKFAGTGETLQLVKRYSPGYTGTDRTNRWVYDGSYKFSSIVGNNFSYPTDTVPSSTARDGGYHGYGAYNWYYANKYHSGADIDCSKYGGCLGRNVYATAAGKVVKRTGNISGWGYTVIIEHNFPSVGKVYSQYSHLSSISAPAVGQPVGKRQIIGKVGGTNGSSKPFAPHLHFEIKRQYAGRSETGYNYDLGKGYYFNHPGYSKRAPLVTNASYLNPRYFDPWYFIWAY